jgi:magnesium transporter
MKHKRHRAARHGARHVRKAGLPPGTPVYTGDAPATPTKLSAYDYSQDRIDALTCQTPRDLVQFRDSEHPTWVNIEGLHDAAQVQEIGTLFGLHALTYEDILNVAQRPKLEDFGDHLFIVLQTLELDETSGEVNAQQVSVVLGKNFLLSFQESSSELFKSVVDAIQHGKGRVRKERIDYLAYRLIDVVVDQYFVIVDKLGARIEKLEELVLANPSREALEEMHALKRALLAVRRAVWPLREVLGALERGESQLIGSGSRLFFRDAYDHTVSVIEMIESNRELLSSVHDLYLTSLNNRLNEVMKVLTVISTMFMPMTLVASIYGMNFKHMPELDKPWGYAAALLIMLAVGLGFWIYFKQKRWV